MKRISALILLAIISFSCSNGEKHEEGSSDWKELDTFHKIMAKAYHPLKDSGDLDPTKQLINQLADAAEKWSDADLPEKVNTQDLKEKLQKLKADARTLANDIRDGASDDLIKDGMTKLHNQFHAIMEAWNYHDDKDEHKNH